MQKCPAVKHYNCRSYRYAVIRVTAIQRDARQKRRKLTTAKHVHSLQTSASAVWAWLHKKWASCPVSTIPLPFFRCRFAVPVSRCRLRIPLPLRSIPTEFDGSQFPCAIVHRVCYITSKKLTINEHIISMSWLVSVDDWLASYGTEEK